MDEHQLRQLIKPFTKPVLGRSIWQMINTLIPLAVLYALMGTAFVAGYWFVVLLLMIPAGAFMVRTFILFHDCTHMSFFKSQKANMIWGHIFGILTFTPYGAWRFEHNRHHGTVGNLDKRGIGDVWTMTVTEYLESGRFTRFIYRLYRNPVFLFFIAPFFLFGFLNRLPIRKMTKQEHVSMVITNLGLLLMAVLGSLWLGFWGYVFIQATTLYFAGVMGVWLFFVQHQFDEVYWQDNAHWEFTKAALAGSSFYKLPIVLDWISGSIGFHHIHHLNPQIPNYNLRRCHKAVTTASDAVGLEPPYTVTFFKSFRLALLHLYDEANGRLISFKTLARKHTLSNS